MEKAPTKEVGGKGKDSASAKLLTDVDTQIKQAFADGLRNALKDDDEDKSDFQKGSGP